MSDLRFYKLLKFFRVKALIYTFKTRLRKVTLKHIVRVDKNKNYNIYWMETELYQTL